MIRWMGGVSMKDRKTSGELRMLGGVEPITTVTRNGRLRWYGLDVHNRKKWRNNVMKRKSNPIGTRTINR